MRVLIRRATHADIAEGRVLKAILKTHRNLNSRPKSPISTRKQAAVASLLCLQPQKLVERERGQSACNVGIFSIVAVVVGSYTPPSSPLPTCSAWTLPHQLRRATPFGAPSGWLRWRCSLS